ncbi:predicted protein [Chaetoceros tenuissimus]|uniref:AP2/ERF domain-containing protein n=1 Tax=Chaetoceros tenuissimus TaxID=426638 RepID=A0AAD3D8D5_9STRA|nr:predicted protein [Chaetoceros tenuissimus]
MNRIGKKDKHSSTQKNTDKSLTKSPLSRVQTKLEEPSRCAQLSTRSNGSTKTLSTLDLSSSDEESPSPVRPLPSKKWVPSIFKSRSIFLDSSDESDASVESRLDHLSNIDNENAGDADSLDGEEVATPTISKISTSKAFQDDRFRGPKTPNPLFGGNLKPDESDSEFSMDECSLDIDTTQKATETNIEFKDIQQSDHSSSRKKSIDRSSTSTASTLEIKLVNGIMEGINDASDNEGSIVHDEESACSEERKEKSMSASSTNMTNISNRDLSHLFQTRDERIEPYDIAKAKVAKHLGLIEHKCTYKGSPNLVFIKQSLRKYENFVHFERRFEAREDYFVDEDFRKLLEKNGWVGPWEPNKDEMQDWGKIVRKIYFLEDLDWQDSECKSGQTYLTVKEGLKGIHFKDLKKMKKYKENVDYFTDEKSLQAFVSKKYNWKGKGSFEEGGKRKRKTLVDLKNNEKDVEESIKYYEDSSRCKKEQEEKQRKKMKRTDNEKAKCNNLSQEGKNSHKNSSDGKRQRSMRGKVSKQNQRVNKKSKRTKHNPPSSKKTKLSKRKEAVPKGGKRRGVQRKGQKFASIISFGKPFYLGMFKLQADAAMCHDLAATFLNSECKTKKCKNFANEEEYEIARQNEVQMANDKCEEQIEFPRPNFPDEASLREKFGLDKPEKTRGVDGSARVTRLQSKMAANRREEIIEILSSDEESVDDENTNDQSFIVNELSTDKNQSPIMTQGQRSVRTGSLKAGDENIQSKSSSVSRTESGSSSGSVKVKDDNVDSRVVQTRAVHSIVAESHLSSEENQSRNDLNNVQGSSTHNTTTNQDNDHLVLKKPLMQILKIQKMSDALEKVISEYCEILYNEPWHCINEQYLDILNELSENELEEMIGFMKPLHKGMVKKWVRDRK